MPRKNLRSIPDADPDRLHDLCGDLYGSICMDEKHPGNADFRVLYLISLNLEEFLQRIRVTIHNCKAGFFGGSSAEPEEVAVCR